MWALVQAGDKLYGMGTDGSHTEITIPAGITIDTTRKLRAAILNRIVMIVNAPTVNLTVDSTATAREMVPRTPPMPPTLAAGAGTGLTGVFKVRFSYGVKDRYGRVLAESPLSPEATITLANTGLAVSAITPSTQAGVNCRFIYRTTTGGDVFFRWADLDDNVITTFDSNMGDAGLSLLPTLNSLLGMPPGSSGGMRMKLITQWKSNLWGVSDNASEIDYLRYCVAQQPWAWPDTQYLPIPKVGDTTEGITALMPRRDDLGVFKRGSAHKIVGDDDASYQRVTITEGAGLVAPDSVQVIRNIGYGLGEDGVYQLDDDGFRNISKDQVNEWFSSNNYFDRSRFPYAEGRWNPALNMYELHLSSPGSTELDRWVGYDYEKKKWLGPHKTAAFTPKCASLVLNAAGSPIPLMGGSNGFVYTMNNALRTDDTDSAIDFDVVTVHTCNTPDIEKIFEQMDVLTEPEAGGVLTVTPTLTVQPENPGDPTTIEQEPLNYDLRLGRERGEVIGGPGRILQLRWRQNTKGKSLTLKGAELPYFELGRM